MAKLTLGSMVTDARGSVGGVVYSRNKGGAYSRARVAPINRNTPAQTLVRANFGANSKGWSASLTAGERTAWTAFAAANPRVNILGASIILSGIAMYQSLNQVLSQIGQGNITDPPPDLSVPALAAVTGGTAASAATVSLTTNAQAVVADAAYYIFATRPLSPGSTPQTSDLRYVTTANAVAAATTVDISDEYVALFGTFNSGASIGLAVSTVNEVSGAVTPALRFNLAAS
jgi:hypothetical protein